jgi:hypothetical protein
VKGDSAGTLLSPTYQCKMHRCIQSIGTTPVGSEGAASITEDDFEVRPHSGHGFVTWH